MANKRSFELREDIEDRLRKKMLFTAFVVTLILIFLTLGFIWIKYEVEGAKGLTFEIKEFLIISTADANRTINKDKNISTDKLEVSQVNDLFIKIEEKNKLNSDDNIKKVSIANFNVINTPEKGKLKVLEPTGDLTKLFTNSKTNFIDKTIEFKGANIDNLEQLETSKKGGTIAFRIENELGSFNIRKVETLEYNSKLLKKFVKDENEIDFEVEFDLIIDLDNGFSYKSTIKLDKLTNGIFSEDKVVRNYNLEDISFKKI